MLTAKLFTQLQWQIKLEATYVCRCM